MKKEKIKAAEFYEFSKKSNEKVDVDTLHDAVLASASIVMLRKFIKDKPLKEQEEMIATVKKSKQEAIERLKARETEKEAGTNV